MDINFPAPDEKVVYEIVDSEHPENNALVPSDMTPPAPASETREEAFQRVAHQARIFLAEQIAKRRAAERLRALVPRVAKRRAKEKVAKASRKRNR
jgi:hypothetical protein